MSKFQVVNILDMIESVGEDATKSILSDFSCQKNPEIEKFVKNNAVDFAKKKMSITYLVIDNTETTRAIFTLTHKAIELTNENLSNTMRKRITRHSKLDEETDSFMVSAFLIAQFGKNDNFESDESLTGSKLMDFTFDVLTAVQHDIGGGLVYLESEDKEKLLNFYSSEPNRFIRFGERYSDEDNVKYIQFLRFL